MSTPGGAAVTARARRVVAVPAAARATARVALLGLPTALAAAAGWVWARRALARERL